MADLAKQSRKRIRRGWLAADTMIGLAIVLALLTTLGAALAKQQRASDRLAETRASVRLAEQTLIAMQTSQEAPVAPPDVTITVTALHASGGAPTLKWVRVTVARSNRVQSLVGLVPAKNVKR